MENKRYNPRPMNSLNSFTSNKGKDRPTLLALCLLISILLHVLFMYFLYQQKQHSETLLTQQKPTIVQLVDKPITHKPKEYELDQQPAKPAVAPPKKSSRLAEQNQRVEKETAPKGEDVRDQSAKAAARRPVQPKSSPESQRSDRQQRRQEPVTAKTEQLPKEEQLPVANDVNLPPIEQLTQLSPDTVNRISSNERAAQERIKQRDDIETGDTVWLNLERGLLISFFRRFRNQIEGVWNYPREAVEKEMQGTLLLRITVDTAGELLDVELLNSSGYDLLDYEAIQAVYRAAPFGPLGKHYPYPDLKIMAHFRYQISGKYIYGQRR